MSLAGTNGIEMRMDKTARDITPLVRRFEWTESMIAGGFSWAMEFATEDWPIFSSLLVGLDHPTYRFRLKNQEGAVNSSTEWKTAIVEGSSDVFRGTALIARVWGADSRLIMRQKARTRAWAQTSVSDLAQRIGQEYGFTVSAETTRGKRDRWQIREDDWTFLHKRVKEASSESGRGDFFLWLDEDTLYLKAPSLSAPSDRRHDMTIVENRVDRFVVGYKGREIDRMGGATLTGVGFDFDRQVAPVFKLDEAKASTMPALSSKVPRAQADGLRVLPVTEGDPQLVEEQTRARWGRVAPRYFSLRVDSRPDLTLKPGMIVEMQSNIDARHNTPFLGRFVVLEVQHVATKSAIVTTASCFRREAYVGDEDPTGVSVAQEGTIDNFRLGLPDLPRVVLTAEVLD